jgi:hypothetical protein
LRVTLFATSVDPLSIALDFPAVEVDLVVFETFVVTLETCVIFLGDKGLDFSFATVALVDLVARVARVAFAGCTSSARGSSTAAAVASLICLVVSFVVFAAALSFVLALFCDRAGAFLGALLPSASFFARDVVLREVSAMPSSMACTASVFSSSGMAPRCFVLVAFDFSVGLTGFSSSQVSCFFVRLAFAFSTGAFTDALRTGFFRRESSLSTATSGTDRAPPLVETMLYSCLGEIIVVDSAYASVTYFRKRLYERCLFMFTRGSAGI